MMVANFRHLKTNTGNIMKIPHWMPFYEPKKTQKAYQNMDIPYAYLIDSGYYTNTCLTMGKLFYYRDTQRIVYEYESTLEWTLKECSYDLLAIPVSIKRMRIGHANLLLINKKRIPWEIERFEPFGALPKATFIENNQNMDRCLQTWLGELFERFHIHVPFVYKKPTDLSTGIGIQARSQAAGGQRGFCQTWTLLYFDIRLCNPDLTASEVQNALQSIPGKNLSILVLEYTAFLYSLRIPKGYQTFNEARFDAASYHSRVITKVKKVLGNTNAVVGLSRAWFKLIANVRDIETFHTLNILIPTLLKWLVNLHGNIDSSVANIDRGLMIIQQTLEHAKNKRLDPLPFTLRVLQKAELDGDTFSSFMSFVQQYIIESPQNNRSAWKRGF